MFVVISNTNGVILTYSMTEKGHIVNYHIVVVLKLQQINADNP